MKNMVEAYMLASQGGGGDDAGGDDDNDDGDDNDDPAGPEIHVLPLNKCKKPQPLAMPTISSMAPMIAPMMMGPMMALSLSSSSQEGRGFAAHADDDGDDDDAAAAATTPTMDAIYVPTRTGKSCCGSSAACCETW